MTKYLMILAALFALVACDGNGIKYTEDGWAIYADLEWAPLSENSMTWKEATDYCEAMGGRLPNINELRKAIIKCPASTYGGACQVSDPDCLDLSCGYKDCACENNGESYSALGDRFAPVWSSSFITDDFYSWVVYFSDAFVHNVYRGDTAFAHCVR